MVAGRERQRVTVELMVFGGGAERKGDRRVGACGQVRRGVAAAATAAAAVYACGRRERASAGDC